MRKAFVAAMSMAVFLGAATPSFAQTPEPARASGAAGFALDTNGLLDLPPTPLVAATQPPDTDQQIFGQTFQSTVPVDLSSLAVNATLDAVAQAASEPRIQTVLADNPDLVSARGFGRTEGLSVVGENSLLQALGLQLGPALVTATAVEGEAVAVCVDNQPVFSTDSNIIDLDVLGLDLGEILNGALTDLLASLNLPGLIEIAVDESGVLPDGSGVFVNALRINLLNGLLELVIGHAEAAMPADCRVPPPPPTTAPRGPGGALAATGTELPFLPLGLAILAVGVILNRAVRRTARRSTV